MATQRAPNKRPKSVRAHSESTTKLIFGRLSSLARSAPKQLSANQAHKRTVRPTHKRTTSARTQTRSVLGWTVILACDSFSDTDAANRVRVAARVSSRRVIDDYQWHSVAIHPKRVAPSADLRRASDVGRRTVCGRRSERPILFERPLAMHCIDESKLARARARLVCSCIRFGRRSLPVVPVESAACADRALKLRRRSATKSRTDCAYFGRRLNSS